MSDHDVTRHCEDTKMANMEDETYKKRKGAAGAEGHLLEINLLTLCKLRGDRQLKHFNLAGNLESAGDFDDVVFRYTDEKGTQNVIFLQSKFKQNANHQITIKTFETDRDWLLQKYFRSFMQIQNQFNKSASKDPIFGCKTDNLNCHFIIYTNANRHDFMTRHVVEVENPINFVLGAPHGQAFKLKLDTAKDLLQGIQHDLEIEQVLKHLMLISNAQCDRLQGDHNFKKYHAFFTQTVFTKDDGYWKYRDHFLEGKFQNQILTKFRQQTFSWYAENKMDKKGAKNDVSSTEIIRHMNENCQLELPKWFGNTMPTFQKQLCDGLIKIAIQCISHNVCTITTMGKKPMNEISKFVGNVLVFDEDKAMFKLNEEPVDGGLREILEYMTKQFNTHNIDLKLYFDIQVENFPRLSLGFTKMDSKNVEEFVEKLTILTGQPNGDSLKKIIERDFGNVNDKEVGRHHHIIGKMTNWWKQLGEIKYLRRDDGFFEGILNGILFNLSDPIQSFTGRTKELATVHYTLQNNDSGYHVAVISQMASISGLGGVGKSEFARKYANVYGHCYDGNIIWVDAETRYSMQNCFLILCKDYLHIQTQDANEKDLDMGTIVQNVYNFFQDRKSLFIFDNAQYVKHTITPNDNINDFLPKTRQRMTMTHFLITSRNKEWRCTVMIDLGVLEDAEAEQLVKSLLGIKDDQQDNDIKELIMQLHNFPLALQQAVAYIRQKGEVYQKTRGTQFRISDYLELYNYKTKEFLEFQFPDDCDDRYTKTTFMTWNITIAEIEKSELGKEAMEIFNIMAYLNPNDIPVKFFTEIVNNDLEKLSQVFILIEKYSMITLRDGMANIHRLVQSVVRLMLQDAEKQHIVLQNAFSLIQTHTDQQLITQGASVWNYANKYGDLITEFNSIPAQVIEALRETQRYEEASAFGKDSLDSLKSKIGLDHVATLSAQFQLGKTLHQQGQYEEALSLHKEVFDKRAKLLGPNHIDTLAAQNNIANTLLLQGQYEEALSLHKVVFEESTTILGPNHPDTLNAQNSTASTLYQQGQYEEALSLYKEVFERRSNTLGLNHPDTLTIQNNICNILSQQGQYEEALRFFKVVFEEMAKVMGPNHPHTLTIQSNIGKTLSEHGQYVEALCFHKEVLEKRTKVLGPNHPDTLTTENNIGNTLCRQGHYEQALNHYKEVCEKRTKVLGPNHPDTLNTQNGTANALLQIGQYDEALSLHKVVFEKRTKICGPNHPDTLSTQNRIAQILFRQGQYEDALSLHIEVFEKRTKVLGPNHPYTLGTQNNISNAQLAILSKRRPLS